MDNRFGTHRVNQRSIAQALGEYYRDRTGSYGRYCARYGSDVEIVTSVTGVLDFDGACWGDPMAEWTIHRVRQRSGTDVDAF